MEHPASFRCPECGESLVGAELSRHLVERPRERARLFARFVEDHEEARRAEAGCSGRREIVPLMDAEERERFGAGAEECGDEVVACTCTGSFCVHHAFSCDTCGRFACLRHRWSGTCPDCTRAATARPVKVEKYDPFSKERSTVVRTYRRSERPEVWGAVAETGD